MKEIREIIQSYEAALQQGKQTALATVVHVQGSSYRRPGARMLITEEGRLTGAISGGCLEGDAMRKALHVIREQRPALVTYDTMDEDDATIGIGLGCKVEVLGHEPVIYPDPSWLGRVVNAMGEPIVLPCRTPDKISTVSVSIFIRPPRP